MTLKSPLIVVKPNPTQVFIFFHLQLVIPPFFQDQLFLIYELVFTKQLAIELNLSLLQVVW